MDLTHKVKAGLDELRMLTLGCQVLVGFQFQAVFQELFADLPDHAKAANIAGLLLMILAVGLLMAPGIHHALYGDHQATRGVAHMTSRMADWALPPFALSLGLDVLIGAEQVYGTAAGVAGGLAFAALALGAWLGWGLLARGRHGRKEREMADLRWDETADVAQKITFMMTEARTILPGAQAMLGFQLAVVLTRAFAGLSPPEKALHAAALGCVALSIILLMAPAAYHRLVYAGEASPRFLTVASRLVTAATLPLGAGMAADAAVTIGFILDSAMAGAVAGGSVLLVLALLWYAHPWRLLRRRLVT
ncbi:hypothetical protein FBZ87_10891 [Nitrospirillum amazonense]|uniref:Uncharacterized protein n=1 Tax=Nitrospirillum amazonense TaxID=28077 RepID=A0A560JF16_9PROT|nr:DUF6328 family protein [Nitrospirillum amazonense]TWB69801.1 hypothetical protein FBZ87_10891 [Nitrospirillum amazonense]